MDARPAAGVGNRRVRRIPTVVRRLLVMMLLLAVTLTGCGRVGPAGDAPSPPAPGRPTTATPASGLPVVKARDLPPAARETLDRIDRGGPYPYRQDGQVFGNRERRLP